MRRRRRRCRRRRLHQATSLIWQVVTLLGTFVPAYALGPFLAYPLQRCFGKKFSCALAGVVGVLLTVTPFIAKIHDEDDPAPVGSDELLGWLIAFSSTGFLFSSAYLALQVRHVT